MQFRYSYEKNSELLQKRGIGFEEIIQAVSEGHLLDIRKHHNSLMYPSQYIMYVRIIDEVYAIPFVQDENNEIFLKTLFPSRKAKKEFLILKKVNI